MSSYFSTTNFIASSKFPSFKIKIMRSKELQLPLSSPRSSTKSIIHVVVFCTLRTCVTIYGEKSVCGRKARRWNKSRETISYVIVSQKIKKNIRFSINVSFTDKVLLNKHWYRNIERTILVYNGISINGVSMAIPISLSYLFSLFAYFHIQEGQCFKCTISGSNVIVRARLTATLIS